MKTEINLENKAKFFAQYYSQGILTLNMNDNYPNQKPWFDFVYDPNYIEPCYLVLKPLISITDEDAIEVAKILRPYSFESHPRGWKIDRCEREIEITHRQSIYEFDIDYEGSLGVDNGETWEYLGNAEQLHAYDYLRSRSYALPWMDLSVKKVVEAGWIKLT